MNSPMSEALLLHATATAIDAQRAKLPQVSAPFRLPDPVSVGRQITELGGSIVEMGDEYLFRADESAPLEHTVLTAEAFANAIGSVAQAASALGTVAQQLAFVARTADKRGEPSYEDAHTIAGELVEHAVETARDDLAEASQILRNAASAISPPSVRLQQAALSRSTPAGRDGHHAPLVQHSTAAAPVAATASTRGRR
ncbi:hypothetical protein PUR71_28995 [Streptomyces sp. SP17BM10]|uniref:hypothetical protein n=1 Tax=Streptomyces sp. SP17BM10 TaxID=3002530 RepID=UPI002E769192|nr:hypothetical protein [Streptomyces sp. SP17BM10]MEE1786911.1 hypothetical protein [Streptomyces sp. SP17BM10]